MSKRAEATSGRKSDFTAQVETVRKHLHDIRGEKNDYDALLDAIGDSQVVLIGEASHGTSEFYKNRADITKRLIEEKGFRTVAVEADWPDAYRVNRYLHHINSKDKSVLGALGSFERFPTWMWRNYEVVAFLDWVENFNRNRPLSDQVSWYGMDLYSLYKSAHEVLKFLQVHDPQACDRARKCYETFMRFEREDADPQQYGMLASMALGFDNECACTKNLQVMLEKATLDLKEYGFVAQDELIYAEQNARVVSHAERYYRAMFSSRDESWNYRDTHMTDTLQSMMEHRSKVDGEANAKTVVWAHNSHLGDARSTSASKRGELNVGQLCRQRFGTKCFNIGFTSHDGTVAAADNWDGPMKVKKVNESMGGSWENLFHQARPDDFMLIFNKYDSSGAGGEDRKVPISPELSEYLSEPWDYERAIGVIYRPTTEFFSHYFKASLSNQFDAVIHLDTTSAIHPID
jgi:erythromycin esterase-like protein